MEFWDKDINNQHQCSSSSALFEIHLYVVKNKSKFGVQIHSLVTDKCVCVSSTLGQHLFSKQQRYCLGTFFFFLT